MFIYKDVEIINMKYLRKLVMAVWPLQNNNQHLGALLPGMRLVVK